MASHGHEPSSGSGDAAISASLSRKDELLKKRARDRKSQQAMRDRTKWQIQNLNEQVRYVTQLLGEKDEENRLLQSRLRSTETELETLRVQNPAQSPVDATSDMVPRWRIRPLHVAPTCMADQIIQNWRSGNGVAARSPGGHTTVYADKPNMCSLLDREVRAEDVLSNIVGDIILVRQPQVPHRVKTFVDMFNAFQSYKEIATLPKQVAVFHGVATLLKWELHLDEPSWKQIPPYFRPILEQLTTPHAAWIDRVPWPRVRRYFIQNPSITLDDFAVIYSTNFNIAWSYEPSHVVIALNAPSGGGRVVIVNPVFEEQLQHIANWLVTETFRVRFPEIAQLIDEDTT